VCVSVCVCVCVCVCACVRVCVHVRHVIVCEEEDQTWRSTIESSMSRMSPMHRLSTWFS
jgi:hypothetical protein